MKNIPELSCAIVEDLLPTYVERLTSEETNMAVEAHLASCPACAAKRTAMGAKETEAAGQNAEETAREVDYLKKVRRRNRRRVWLAVACTTLVLAAVILTKIFIIGGPGQANDVGVRLVERIAEGAVHGEQVRQGHQHKGPLPDVGMGHGQLGGVRGKALAQQNVDVHGAGAVVLQPHPAQALLNLQAVLQQALGL